MAFSPSSAIDDLAEFILSSGLPAVEISMVRNEIQLPRLEGDSDMIGRLAAEHFLERGYRMLGGIAMTRIGRRQQVARECVDDLLECPLCAGRLGDVEMDDSAPLMGDNHQHVEQTKSHRGNHEEVHGRDRTGVVPQKGPPAL